MSYIVSARKWRPQTFDEVIGQRHVIQTLRNAIKSNRVAHAYLFSGMRGVGKTTTARIIAKGLNCERGPTPDPCNECESCKGIMGGYSVDVMEIDGASNTGVDDVRELRESVRYAPSRGRYKVYIIDEVHMLSKNAFNALLKTLEEPPKHVVFIFATTEPNRIPDTISSRCQCFDLKYISLHNIVEHLLSITKKEGIIIDRDSVELIARSAEGSMRDAQSLLDQVISYSDKEIKMRDVTEILGLVDRDILRLFIDKIMDKDSSWALEIFHDLLIYGNDIKVFCKEILEYLKNLTMVKVVNKASSILKLAPEDIEYLKRQGEKIGYEELQQIFNIVYKVGKEIRQSSNPITVFEMAIIRMTQVKPVKAVDAILYELNQIERKISKPHMNHEAIAIRDRKILHSQPEERDNTPKAPLPITKEERRINDTNDAKRGESMDLWKRIKEEVKGRKGFLVLCLENGEIVNLDEKKIEIGFRDSITRDTVNKKDNLDIIADSVKAVLGGERKIVINLLPSNKRDKDNIKIVEGEKRGTFIKKVDQGHQIDTMIDTMPSQKKADKRADKREIVQDTLKIFGGSIV
ncbi:MAG: DNA polymerase III subunit gamma/tau [Nitrospinae bacterium]|nr:DNA polymerase III subunit gamma/tau [Nitrospinota bacterium]